VHEGEPDLDDDARPRAGDRRRLARGLKPHQATSSQLHLVAEKG